MSDLKIALHQPNFIPYLGFFDKLRKVDLFVIRDEVLFIKREFHNRNRIRINSNDNLNNPQSKWIKVPVNEIKDFIKHIKIKRGFIRNSNAWHEHILHEIKTSYEGAPFFDRYYPKLRQIFNNTDDMLLSLNMKIIRLLMDVFNIKTKIIMASDLNLKKEHYQKSDASEDIVDICKALGAKIYLSGTGGVNYLDLKPFKREGISVEFHKYDHPVYKQRFPGFVPYLSALDALFCIGQIPARRDILDYVRVHSIIDQNSNEVEGTSAISERVVPKIEINSGAKW